MRKFTICMLVLASLGLSNSKVVLANNFENDLKSKAENIEEVVIDSEDKEEVLVNEGWNLAEGKYFFVKADGEYQKGWYNDGQDWYHLDNNTGEMNIGWFEEENQYYYLNDNGAMAKGWLKENNKWYHFSDNGSMTKGWLKESNKWYFLDDNGVMVTGYKDINGKRYYFESNGMMNNGLGLVIEAKKHVGKAYVSGGNGPNVFDCSGLTKYVYKQMGVDLTRTTYDQVKQGRAVSRDELKPGDLIFSHGTATAPGHVGIYSGNGKYVHAANSRQGVIESPIYSYATARRIIED